MSKSSSQSTALSVWQPPDPIKLPSSAQPTEIAAAARQLTTRDQKSIVSAFQAESYEMVSTFVWARAIASLKKQIASLGMDFVGEMLRRQDVTDSSDPLTSIGDYEALSLAEDLGMVNTTEALRLKQALELVSHFSDPDVASGEEMAQSEAVSILRHCVSSVLGNPSITPPMEFAALRKTLEEKTLASDSSEVSGILASPYFFQRTTLSVILSLVRTADGARLEHAVGNANAVIPALWTTLRQPEKWQVGNTYSVVAANGERTATAGLKKVLLAVQGFDFVPENLRSHTYTQAAHRVMEAHFGWNNFYNEGKPTRQLSNLGSTIPKPAFPVCMTALLCVRLGNSYGEARDASRAAHEMLTALRREQWEYYLTECLRSDKTILDKIASGGRTTAAWLNLVEALELSSIDVSDRNIGRLLPGDSPSTRDVMKAAETLRLKAAR